MKKLINLSLVVVLCLCYSCSNDDEDNTPVAPGIPPESSMIMPFESFEPEGGRLESKINAGVARLTVAFWQLASSPLLIPAAAFRASFNQNPVYENNSWIWRYGFTHVGAQYQAELHASLGTSAAVVNWEMYITKEGEFEDFLWFDGTSQLDGLGGAWVLYKSPDEPSKVLDIDWSKNVANSIAEIQYTNIEGGYINYGINEDEDYDAYYIIRGNNGDIVQILWNREKGNGQLINVEGEEFCWDQNYDDIDC